jgi:zinc protease
MMYGDHPFGRDSLGTPQSNAAITRDALAEFHATYFAPKNMVITVAGALSAEDAVRRVEAALGDWDAGRPQRAPVPPLPSLDGPRDKFVRIPEKFQSDIIMGWRAMRRTDPDYESARLANTILGVFGMMGRLGESVRETQGLAYYSYSSLSGGKESGSWVTSAGVAPENVERASASILEEVARLRTEPVPEDELEDSKRYLIGSLPLQLETNEGVASLLLDLEWHALGLDYLERYTNAIERLTSAEVQDVAARYLVPDAFVRAVAGS